MNDLINQTAVGAERLPILLAPHKGLALTAAPVRNVDGAVKAMLDQLLATMYGADGVGLAATQVGLLQRLVVIDIGHPSKEEPGKRDYSRKNPLLLVNPTITRKSSEYASRQEGCLSLPGLYAEVERPAAVSVRYFDARGSEQTLDAEGLLSVCLQHEIDHLDGVLFPQRMSKLRRELTDKKYVKKRQEWLAKPAYPFELGSQ